MNESELTSLATMRDCWITGSAAFPVAPTHWQAIAEEGDASERERRLLAIAGQAFAVALRPAAPKTLTRRALLPQLALPILPQSLFPLFRTALKQANDNAAKARVAALVASRGFVAHPLDYLPSAADEYCPAVYAPWMDWRSSTEVRSGPAHDGITIDSWDDFYPAARRLALTALRKSDPAAARTIIEAKASSEAAEARLAIIDVLRVNLNAEDVAYLASLASDRSGKVRQLAAQLLARLGARASGQGAEALALVAELAEFIEQSTSGLFRRKTIFRPLKLKSNAQENRRAELFELCQLIDLAARFEVDERQFIDAWQIDVDDKADLLLAKMVVASGSDMIVQALADRLIGSHAIEALIPLVPRFDTARKTLFFKLVFAGKTNPYNLLNVVGDLDAGTCRRDEAMKSGLYQTLREMIRTTEGRQAHVISSILDLLGFLVSADAAEAIVNDLVAIGYPPADPTLGTLRLNSALVPAGANAPN